MNFIRRLYHYFSKLAAYARLLWNDFDWDWVYIMIVLRYKIERTRRCIKSNDVISDVDEVCHQMRVAELLIDRIVENDYCACEWGRHETKWGELQIKAGEIEPGARSCPVITYRDKVLTEEDQKREHKESLAIMRHEDYMLNQDIDYLFRHLRSHLRDWWD